MQGFRFSPYKRNVSMAAVHKGNIERVREIINSRDLCRLREWSEALDGYVLLLTALQKKHTHIAKLLLTNGSKVNKNNKKPCNTPLHHAIRNGDIEIVQMLLDRGANINVRTLKRRTALHIAVEVKKMDIIGILLNHGAHVKTSDINNITPLHTAIKNDSTEIVKLLVSRGADVNARTCDGVVTDGGKGCTPLHLAVENNNEEITKLLLSSGADVDAERIDGITSFRIAMKRGYLQIVEHILQYKASVNAVYTSPTQNEHTPLHVAVEEGNEEITKLFLIRGANVNAQGNDDITPLHIATRAGYLNIVELLLKHGADVHFTSQNGHTPLYCAVESGDEKIVKLLLEHGARVDAKDKTDKTILLLAVEKESPIIVEQILKHSPDLNNKSNSSVLNVAVRGHGIGCRKIVENLLEYGFTITCKDANCMHAAIENGYVEIVKELLKYDTNVNTLYDSTSEEGYIPLHVATKKGHEEMAKLLISYGADVNAPDEIGKTPIFYAIENGELKIFKLLLTNNVNVSDNHELLNIAVKGDHREIVEVLLQHGADVNASDEYGRTPLHFTVVDKENNHFGSLREGPRINAKVEVAKLLLSRGANANTRLENSMTVLHAAIDLEYVKVVEALLEYDTDVNSTCEHHVTPLHISARRGNKVITKMLLNKGANINAEDASGETALHYATEGNHEVIVELLLNRGINVNATTKGDLITPLHIAAECGYQNIAQLLLNFGANVDSTNGDGLTALHIATIEGHEEIITLLLEYGSDITVKSEDHYTVLDFAMDGIKAYCGFNYNSKYNDRKTSAYINIAEILKRHVIKMRVANSIAQNDGILSIETDDEELNDPLECEINLLRVYSKTARKTRRLARNNFQNNCKKEIAHMKSEKFVNTNISFYDILTKDVDRLAMYTRNESIVKAFGSGDYKEKIPIYADMLNSNIRIGEKRNEFLEQCNKNFDLLFNDCPELPRDCTEIILGYLKDDDLRALTDAYCNNVIITSTIHKIA